MTLRRTVPSFSFLVAALFFSTAFAFIPACGGDNEASVGRGPGSEDASVNGSGGSAGTLGIGGFSGASGAAGSAGSFGTPERCGGAVCANNKGDKTFMQPNVPAKAPELFGGGTPHAPGSNPARQPAIIYPNHETMFPINVSRIRHEWSGAQSDLFKLVFTGPNTTVSVYTVDRSFIPSEEQWDWIAESNRGKAVSLHVEGLTQASPADIWKSSPIELLFSDSEVEGAIYYWSTGTKGIMRALVSDPIPQKFYTDPAATDSGQCVACHTLSRDGKRLAVGYGGETLREVSVPERKTLVPSSAEPPRAAAWTTFSPDGTRLLVAAGGKLTLIDANTGAPVGPNAGLVPIPVGKIATHPDWSALGNQVAITLGTKGGNKEVEGGSIALLAYNAGAWGAPQIVVSNTGATDNNFFPSFSPDSKWIVYAHATGKSKDAVSASLRMVSASGGTPILLERLNQRVNNVNGVLGVGNSMPTWAPSTKAGTFWLAFSSLRAYATLRPQDKKEDQIFIAAIDPSSKDPGYAAFWAPFQSLQEGNHRAFWTHASEDKQCSCVERCGDSLDNDCDGTADEAGCTVCQAVEICGDKIDNDCNCVVDECNVENCTDGIDNDGDGLTDQADPACQIAE